MILYIPMETFQTCIHGFLFVSGLAMILAFVTVIGVWSHLTDQKLYDRKGNLLNPDKPHWSSTTKMEMEK